MAFWNIAKRIAFHASAAQRVWPARYQGAQSDSEIDLTGELVEIANSPALRNLTPHSLAVVTLQIVMELDASWRATHAETTGEAHLYCPMACEFYQLHIYLELLAQKFGTAIASLIETSFVSLTDAQDIIAGPTIFARVKSAISRARQLGPSSDAPDDLRMRMEYQIADQLLKTVYSYEPPISKQKPRFSLAASLCYARIWAEAMFPDTISKIDFDPASIACVKREIAYKGKTLRWRDKPGCFERHLQRMEGNPLFSEIQRNPSNDEIEEARAKDDADRQALERELTALLSNFEGLCTNATVQCSVLLDLAQFQIEPLMERASALGEITSAQRYLETLTALFGTCLDTVARSSNIPRREASALKESWAWKMNSFCAQLSREGSPITRSQHIHALACESVENIRGVLEASRKRDPDLIGLTRNMFLLSCDLADLEKCEIPGKAEKLALFENYTSSGAE
jgi:hypothetical protein